MFPVVFLEYFKLSAQRFCFNQQLTVQFPRNYLLKGIQLCGEVRRILASTIEIQQLIRNELFKNILQLTFSYLEIYQLKFENIQTKNTHNMQALNENTTIKLNIEHNISSNKMMQVRFDLNQTVLAAKQNIESRYGSLVSYMKLQLKDQKGILKAQLSDDMKTLGHYGADSGMIIYVIDLNPNSIHKQIQSFEGVQKYTISEQDYDKLSQNFRKWKKQLLKNHPQLIKTNKAAYLALQQSDPDYMSQLAGTIEVGNRCKLQNGARGVVCYVGKIVDKGPGYYVGVKLDEPFGDSNGIVKGVKYFDAGDKYAAFVRPNDFQVGDFPELDLDDEI